MTGIIAIDESGDLGKNGSRFFVISAVMSERSRNLLRTSKMIDNRFFESKYRNTSKEDISELLHSLVNSGSVITYVVVDKHDFNSPYYDVYGNNLFRMATCDLFDKIEMTSPTRDVKVYVDRTSVISQKELETFCKRLHEINILSQSKVNSSSNKCIQIADFVAGAIWHRYERNELEHYSIIKGSIRRP